MAIILLLFSVFLLFQLINQCFSSKIPNEGRFSKDFMQFYVIFYDVLRCDTRNRLSCLEYADKVFPVPEERTAADATCAKKIFVV